MIELGRFIVPLIAPLPIILVLNVLGLGFLLFSKRKSAIVCVAVALATLLVLGSGLGTKPVLYGLERSYVPLSLEKVPAELAQKIRYIVVLGSGHVSNRRLPVTAQIGSDSLFRLVEAVRIHRHLPGSKLVISGGPLPDDPVTNAAVVADVARAIGVDDTHMIVEDRPKDTYSEARMLKDLLGNDPFVLVTSAAHMQRAVRTFQGFDMHPIPAPTDFILKKSPDNTTTSWLPTCGNLGISKRVIYEGLGRAWGKLRQLLNS